MVEASVHSVMETLATMEDPKARAVNEKHGDDHGVNLTKLRAVAKELKKNEELAVELWETGDSAARLVAILIMRPRSYDAERFDAMLRDARVPKVHAWLVNYIVKKSKHAETLRLSWMADPDPVVASAGWALTSERVNKSPEGLDLPGLLDIIEAQMLDAEERLQWAMNETLSYIGIENEQLRPRAIAIGNRLGVLKDYPTPPNCTSPFAPTWITEIVARREAQ
ncbi:DNA alkylation repair protein [Brevibacterium sp. UCMA 11752]|uniref:DNA alkylation repair protein n=1 Tax=Brevibacterium sp. UCMA 11752 TaxID=2745946 RepID=UPI001F341CC3|nr:DNA alkylation repair protein [Brevibacterium sp. UCMA 11752]MCF2589125.1 DNA alkylation repair protein [Brevibacterium sp. UCMA 11752]